MEEVKIEIVDMRIGFVIGGDFYTIKDGLNKGVLRMGDWFERNGDLYRLIGCYKDDNKTKTYIGLKVKKDRTHKKHKLIIYEGDGNMFEDEPFRYYFNENDEIRLSSFNQWRCIE